MQQELYLPRTLTLLVHTRTQGMQGTRASSPRCRLGREPGAPGRLPGGRTDVAAAPRGSRRAVLGAPGRRESAADAESGETSNDRYMHIGCV